MGDKIQYYCLNEPMTCDILASQSVLFGHRLCAHQALHSQIPPEPNGGSAAPLILLCVHSTHTFYISSWISFYQSTLQFLNIQ